MTSTNRPLTLLVHGAWHRPAHFRSLIRDLRGLGHTVLAPPLASSGYDDSIDGTTHLDDVRRVHEVLLPYLDAGREAVVLAHSYGGVVATEAIEHHTVAERKARGLPGGIKAVIYVAASPAVAKGVSMYEAGGNMWHSLHIHTVGENKLPLIKDAPEVFFHDVECSIRKEATALLAGQSRAPFEKELTYTIQEIQIPKTYVLTKLDRAIPPSVQQLAIDVGGCKVVEMECGHSPFLKDTERAVLVQLVVVAAGGIAVGA
ncbi:Alpha/beta hydrolase fold-1 [Coniochaeta sp. 2T2.1]|nr:Alpha/beta hydrolase fold-1 [Coniochaeta sp. 2T2.1]